MHGAPSVQRPERELLRVRTQVQPALGLLRLLGAASDALLWRHHQGRRHRKHKKHRGHKGHHSDRTLWLINATHVKDSPRFQHRGLLIDSGRHFLPVPIIKVCAGAAPQLRVFSVSLLCCHIRSRVFAWNFDFPMTGLSAGPLLLSYRLIWTQWSGQS
jgi:hypothetical protein